MKFIKALDGRYINSACVHTLYINSISKNENWVVGIPRDDEETQDYLFGSFKDYKSAEKFLDKLVAELNKEGN